MSGHGGFESMLPLAAAVALTVATDGAAAPLLEEQLAAEGAAMAAGEMMAPEVLSSVAPSFVPETISGGSEFLGSELSPEVLNAWNAGQTDSLMTSQAFEPTASTLASDVPQPLVKSATYDPMQLSQEGFNLPPADKTLPMDYRGMNEPMSQAAIDKNLGKEVATNKGLLGSGKGLFGTDITGTQAMMGLGGLGLLGGMLSERNQYGMPAQQTYNGPLSQFKYSPSTYTPVTTTPPANPYKATYARPTVTPRRYAEGGIAGTNPSVGPVEEMSRLNATGNNQMFPQAAVNSDAFSSATNSPLAQNMLASASDTNVDPYTGAETFAMGGLAATKRYAEGGSATPDQITRDAVARNQQLMNMVTQGADKLGGLGNIGPQYTKITPENQAQYQPEALAYTAPVAAPTVAPVQYAGLMVSGSPAANQAALDAKTAEENKAYQDWIDRKNRSEYEASLNPYSGGSAAGGGLMPQDLHYAMGGGVGTLGSYAAGGNPRLLKGPGDGMSDNIPATIGGKQPARLADGEFVVPADVVSHLGNGSTDAGAKHLYSMMDKVRKARTGSKKQGKQIKSEKYLKA